MIRAIDHIVILVADLAAASADYTALGFTVTPGGEHADGATHHALVIFADDSYLELIAFKRPAPEHRWWRHAAAGEGLIDFALLPTAIDEDVVAARARGLPLGEPTSGGRLRPDGQRVAWQVAQPPMPDLPFLCGDVTPRDLRVPGGAARRHANGVVGIAAVTVAVRDLTASMQRYRALLGAEPARSALTISGLGDAAFALGTSVIELAARDDERADPVAARIAARGEGPYALRLRAENLASAGPLDTGRTHGVPIELVPASG
jgi:catechol 2,3-dioxygenase-like lactoylglutathione lyase family enzyme